MANTFDPADDNDCFKLLLAGMAEDPDILAQRKQIEELQVKLKAQLDLLKVQQKTQNEIEFAQKKKTNQKTKPKNQFVEEIGINLKEINKEKHNETMFESHKKFNKSVYRYDSKGRSRCYHNVLNKCPRTDKPDDCKLSHCPSMLIVTNYYKWETLNNSNMAQFMAEDVGTTSDDVDVDPVPDKIVLTPTPDESVLTPVPDKIATRNKTRRRRIDSGRRRYSGHRWNRNIKQRPSIKPTHPPTFLPTAISPISTSINPILPIPTSTHRILPKPMDPPQAALFLAATNNNKI